MSECYAPDPLSLDDKLWCSMWCGNGCRYKTISPIRKDMLIKLTTIPHPDFDEGQSKTCYVDATRIISITRSKVAHAKEGSAMQQRLSYDVMWENVRALNDKIGRYIPNMEDPVAASWMVQIRETAQVINAAYSAWSKAYQSSDYHPPVACTEIQLACGTALEHGVMLARINVMESPEEVAKKVHHSIQYGWAEETVGV